MAKKGKGSMPPASARPERTDPPHRPVETQAIRTGTTPTSKIPQGLLPRTVDGNQTVHVGLDYHRILLHSRFEYYFHRIKKPSDSQRAADLIDYVLWKYNLSFPFTPKYDGNMTGDDTIGETRSNGLWWDGVYVGRGALKTEHRLASTLIHENVHYRSGKENVKRSGDGSVAYDKWVASDFTRSLSTRDVENIYRWIIGEYAAINAEKNHVVYSYMSRDDKDSIEDYFTGIKEAENNMIAQGYPNPNSPE